MILYSKVTAQPDSEPVTLDQVKEALKMTGIDTEDTYLTALITTARKQCEIEAGLSIIDQTRQIKLDKFPSGVIQVPYGPVSEITTLEYIDSDGATQTLTENTHFLVDTHSDICRLQAIDSWPSTKTRINAVTVTYQAGYADASVVPQIIKDIIIRLVVLMHNSRGDEAQNGYYVDDYVTLRLIDSIRVNWNAHY